MLPLLATGKLSCKYCAADQMSYQATLNRSPLVLGTDTVRHTILLEQLRIERTRFVSLCLCLSMSSLLIPAPLVKVGSRHPVRFIVPFKRRCPFEYEKCYGGLHCLHSLVRHCRSPETILASLRYDYGKPDRELVRSLRTAIETNFLCQRLPLSILKKCGGDVTILMMAGYAIETLVNRGYLFDDILRDLELDWRLLLAFGFLPELVATAKNRNFYPLISLYDLLGVRARQIYDFYRSAAQIRELLGDQGVELFQINLNNWVI